MRLLWADIMKIVAIFGVILLHVSAPYLIPFETSPEWWIGNIYDSLTRWCVPLFVMVSGAIILPKAETIPYRRFFLVRVRRILIPFLIWSGVYFWYRIHIKEDELVFSDFFRMLLTDPIYYHLWFVYMLIVLYMLAPVLSAFLKNSPKKHAWFIIAFWFAWASLLPVIDAPLKFETYFTPDMDDYSPLRLSGYFLLGYMLRNWHVRSRLQLSMTIMLFLVGGVLTIMGTFWLSRARGAFDPFFYKYFSVTVVAMTISLFVLVRSIFNTRKVIDEDGKERIRLNSPKLLHKIGMSVFGVYLVHALTLELLRDGHLGFAIDHTSAFGIEFSLALGLPFFAVSIFVFSLLPVLVIRFVPIARDMVT